MKTEYSKKVGTTKVTIKADFGEACDQILVKYSDCGEDAEYEGTGKQVADFSHDSDRALSYFSKNL